MKKTISIVLTLAMVVALAACVSVKAADNPFEKAKGPEPAVTAEPTTAPLETPTPEPTAAPIEEPTPEPTPTPASTAVPTPTEVPVDTGLAEANEKLKAVQSFHMDVEMNMDMDMVIAVADMKQSIPVDMGLLLGADVVQDPLLLRAEMTISAVGETTYGLIYGAKDGEHTAIYISLDKGAAWQKRTDPEGKGMLYAPSDVLNELMHEGIQMHPSGTMDVNGKPATVYMGKIDGHWIQEIFDSTGAFGEMSEAVDMDLPEDALKDMADMDMAVMIDEETGLPVRYTIDMTAAMNSLMAVILQESLGAEDLEGMAFTMDVSTAVLNVTLSRFDSIDPIVIPEAALNALEAE